MNTYYILVQCQNGQPGARLYISRSSTDLGERRKKSVSNLNYYRNALSEPRVSPSSAAPNTGHMSTDNGKQPSDCLQVRAVSKGLFHFNFGSTTKKWQDLKRRSK